MSLDQNWFSEAAQGYAMSLEINQKLHEEQSPHQLIEIYETKTFGRLMTLDGITMLTSRDNFIYHEMMSHPALFNYQHPKDVAIVGGGDCGTLNEVLKHDSVKQVIQIELDERVTRVAEQFFPELCERNNDPRANLLFEDAIGWMQNAKAESLDVIILDTTDPVGQAKRLFAEPFYRDCLNALREGGIVVAQSESPLMDMKILVDLRSEMLKAGYTEIQTIQFPVATYPSGWWTATQARKGQKFGDFAYREVGGTTAWTQDNSKDGRGRVTSGTVTEVESRREQRPKKRMEQVFDGEQMARLKPFKTKYYNADIHKACSALPQFMQDAF